MNAADEEQFVDFVRSSSPALLRVAWLLCGDTHLAEELVQESFERVYPRWRKVRGGQPLAYTRRVMINLNTDRWRRRHGELLTRDGCVPEPPGTDSTASVDDRRMLLTLLQQLPDRERHIVVLRHYADLSEREVADSLNISVGTVKSASSRGLATMRAAMLTMQEARS